MKTLLLVRHGKSSWNHEVEDIQRPLKKRAFSDAEKVVAAIKPQIHKAPTMWSSTAVRALDTAKIFKRELGIEEDRFYPRQELYTFNSESLLKIISSCDDSVQHLMVFGHNPAITELVNAIGDQVFENIPTTGLVHLEFQSDSWKEIANGSTVLYLFPKNL